MQIPYCLDIVNLQIELHVGHEIGGHDQLKKSNLNHMSAKDLLKYYQTETRPVLVISKHEFNQFGMIECMLITTYKIYMVEPFKSMMIKIKTQSKRVHGYVAPFQILGYDYVARHGLVIDKLTSQFKPEIDYYIKGIFN